MLRAQLSQLTDDVHLIKNENKIALQNLSNMNTYLESCHKRARACCDDLKRMHESIDDNRNRLNMLIRRKQVVAAGVSQMEQDLGISTLPRKKCSYARPRGAGAARQAAVAARPRGPSL
jgi:hypothetical protein